MNQPPQQRIFRYDPPRALAANLWQIRGSLAVPGIPRNMTVARLPEGRLVLYSVIAMHEEGMRALEALGEPAFMVMPHDRHQMDAPFYKQRYPKLRVLAPAPASPRSVPIDAGLQELTSFGLRAYALPGTGYHEAVLELPIEDGFGLCVCELLSNLAAPGPMGLLLKAFGPPGGGLGVARVVRWREVVDRRVVRAWIRGLAERRDILMVLVGHGSPTTENVREALDHAARGA